LFNVHGHHKALQRSDQQIHDEQMELGRWSFLTNEVDYNAAMQISPRQLPRLRPSEQ
jgi:hypothetical protein